MTTALRRRALQAHFIIWETEAERWLLWGQPRDILKSWLNDDDKIKVLVVWLLRCFRHRQTNPGRHGRAAEIRVIKTECTRKIWKQIPKQLFFSQSGISHDILSTNRKLLCNSQGASKLESVLRVPASRLTYLFHVSSFVFAWSALKSYKTAQENTQLIHYCSVQTIKALDILLAFTKVQNTRRFSLLV